MSNHYHLVLERPDGNLSRGMRQLNGVYTQRFNARHERVGHVFQCRHKARSLPVVRHERLDDAGPVTGRHSYCGPQCRIVVYDNDIGG